MSYKFCTTLGITNWLCLYIHAGLSISQLWSLYHHFSMSFIMDNHRKHLWHLRCFRKGNNAKDTATRFVSLMRAVQLELEILS